MLQILGLLVIAAAICAVFKKVDVRLALLSAAVLLSLLGAVPLASAGEPLAFIDNFMTIVRKFLETFSNERFVVPICTAMGFAYVLRHTGCDRHLVHLLIRPLLKVRPLLLPGTVVVGFLVNIPIVSQTSTAVALGSVVLPILQAAKISPVTTGATLLLGCSIGGELLNPAAPELRTTVEVSAKAAHKLKKSVPDLTGQGCVQRILPLNLLGLLAATLLFWWLSLRAEAQATPTSADDVPTTAETFQVSLSRAAVPLVPLLLLFLVGPPLRLFEVPPAWFLENVPHDAALPRLTPEQRGLYDCRLVGFAMLVGIAAAGAVAWRQSAELPRAFFEGAGYGFTHIISLIVTANCFGEGVKLIRINELVGDLIDRNRDLLIPLAGTLPLGFAYVCGSGMASAQSLFGFFAEPALRLGVDPAHVGAVVSLASAMGRTMSPVAAVTLMCASMTGSDPFALMRRVALPLLFGMLVVIVAAVLLVPYNMIE